jgi:hypothetical protein
MNDINGINGSYANLHGGVEKHIDGSFTLFATIQDSILFHKKYMGYDFPEALSMFREALQQETDKYFLNRSN